MAQYENADLFSQEKKEAIAMQLLSNSLLRAIWREHPDQMRFAMAAGRQVVRP